MSARDDYPEAAGPTLSAYITQHALMCDEIDRLRNALLWIHYRAYVHYIGGAFDPEHMGALADAATDALNGEPVEDFDAAMARAKVKAKEWAAMFAHSDTAAATDVPVGEDRRPAEDNPTTPPGTTPRYFKSANDIETPIPILTSDEFGLRTDVPVESGHGNALKVTDKDPLGDSTGRTFECPSKIAGGRADRCGQYSFPTRCHTGQCSMSDAAAATDVPVDAGIGNDPAPRKRATYSTGTTPVKLPLPPDEVLTFNFVDRTVGTTAVNDILPRRGMPRHALDELQVDAANERRREQDRWGL